MSCPSTPTFSPFRLLSDVSTDVSNSPDDLSADVVPRSESERIPIENEVRSFLGTSSKIPHPRKTYWKSVRLLTEPPATQEHTEGKNRQWYVQCTACIRAYNKGLMLDIPKTVKSDPKTLDRHLISCEYTVKNRFNWSGINLCAGKKRALVDVSTPPAAKMCKGSLGMSPFVDRPMSLTESGKLSFRVSFCTKTLTHTRSR